MNNPEIMATLGTQDTEAIKNEQSRDNGNIGYTRHKFLIAPVSCVPNVAIISGLFILDCPCVLCTQCCHYLWIVHS
jgi:hypothetical protein